MDDLTRDDVAGSDEAVSDDTARGVRAVLVATVAAGAIGYLIQGLAAGNLTPSDYLSFSVFWSTLYLLVAGLSGLQQEITRATTPGSPPPATIRLGRVGMLGAAAVVMLVAVTGAWWAPTVFRSAPLAQSAALAVGLAGYAVVAVVSGLFYGVRLWTAVAALTIVDAVLRLALTLLALLVAPEPAMLAAAVAAPFPLSVALVWWWARRRVGPHTVDVGPRQLARNVTSTIGGAIAIGVLTSGFPLLIDLTSAESDAAVGALIFVITLSRAPLVVPALAMQSFLTVYFRDRGGSPLRPMLRIIAAVLAVSAVVAAGAWLLEPWLLTLLWGEAYAISGATCAAIVGTAGLTAALCVSGAATLAVSRHTSYLAGWGAAAAATVLGMLVPLPLEPRVLTAMVAGPVIGLLVHVHGVRVRRQP